MGNAAENTIARIADSDALNYYTRRKLEYARFEGIARHHVSDKWPALSVVLAMKPKQGR